MINWSWNRWAWEDNLCWQQRDDSKRSTQGRKKSWCTSVVVLLFKGWLTNKEWPSTQSREIGRFSNDADCIFLTRWNGNILPKRKKKADPCRSTIATETTSAGFAIRIAFFAKCPAGSCCNRVPKKQTRLLRTRTIHQKLRLICEEKVFNDVTRTRKKYKGVLAEQRL